MARLQLTQGKYAIIDDEDYSFLSQWKWSFFNSGYGYAIRNDKKKMVLLHRQIMGFPESGIDHVNGDGLDNRKTNLRVCSQLFNTKNSSSHRDSVSKYKGVSWHGGLKKWRARIMSDGIMKHLGVFRKEVDAAIAYNKAAEKYHCQFAKLNVIKLT